MSRKILFSLYLFFFSVLLLCTFSGCKEPLEELSPPDNLRVEKRILYWDEVENAAGYILNIGKEEFTVTDCSFPLYSFTADGELCIIDVAAIGDGKEYDDSSWARIDVSLDAAVQNGFDESGLEYTLLEDKSGYEVSRGKVELEGVITIPSFFNDYPVKHIARYAFVVCAYWEGYFPEPFRETNCNRLTTGFVLPEYLESIDDAAFAGCARIEEIVIPETVTEIGVQAFYACNRLKKVNIPEGIKTIPAECFRCTPLEEIVIPDGVEEIGKSAFQCEYKTFSDGDERVYHIDSALSTVIIPQSVKVIGRQAFYGRENLVNFTFPNSVEELHEYVFYETAWYQAQPDGMIFLDKFLYGYKGELPENSEIIIPETVQRIAGYAFYQQENLTKVIIPSSVSWLGKYIFSYCSNLEEVILPEGLKELPTGIFRKTINLKSITIPDTVSVIKPGAFRHSGLESIYVPASVKTIDQSAFYGCENLHTVYMEEGVEDLGDSAFLNCPNLVNIHLPSTLKNIVGWIFSSCGAEMIVIPATVERINFLGKCKNLKYIYYEGTVNLWNRYTEETGKTLDSYFPNAVFYVYSEGKPDTEGNFWRYVDGVPTIW